MQAFYCKNAFLLRPCRNFAGFATVSLLVSGVYLLTPLRAKADLRLDIARSGTNVVLTWTNTGAALEQSLAVTGLWSEVTGAVSPYSVPPTNRSGFYRLRESVTQPNFDYRYLAPAYTTLIGDPVSGCGCTSPENPNGAGGNSQDNGTGSVFLHTGEFVQYAIDLEIPGRGFGWRFERRYRSGMNYDGPLGYGWDFNYNRRLVVETNGNVLRVDGAGRADRYTLSGGVFQSPSGFYTQLTKNLDGTFQERDRHGTTNFFSAANALGVARLTRIGDRNGNQMTFQYNAASQLTNTVDTLNRSISYNYDANGRLTDVVDFIGRTLQFGYDANGDLVSARSPMVTGTPNGNDFPSGKTTLYAYASGFGDARFNHNLLSVTAPNEVAVAGAARLVAQYDTNPVSTNADRLVTLRFGGTNTTGVGAGGTLYYTYASLGSVGSNDFVSPVLQNTVTNRNGNVTEYRFNQLGNVVRTIQFTRGVRAGDPPGFTNTAAYNRDGEMTVRTNAEQDTVEYTFDSANPDRLQQGNLRQARRLPGPRGGDQSQIVVSNSYEVSFNFVATSTDARGNTTTHSYDARGNRTNTVHRIPSITDDFEYNAFGQLTAHTLPDNGSGHRRRDVMTYYSSGPQTGYLQNSVVDSGGFDLTTTYEYDAVGNVTRMIDPRGNDSTNVVNELNQVVRSYTRAVSTTNGLVRYQTDTFYDANNNVARVEVENRDDTGAVVLTNPAFTTTYAYDILDSRLSTTREVDIASIIVTTNAYDANQNQVLAASGEAVNGNQPNNIVQTLYDERDMIFRSIRAPGSAIQSTTQYDYDRNGNLVRTAHGTEDAGGHVTLYAYDGYDRRIGATDAMGNVTTLRYDSNGNTVTNRTDGELIDVPGSAGNTNLSQTAYTYDALDRRTRSDVAFFDTQTHTNIGDGQATTRFTYSDTSQVLAVIDDNSHTNRTGYDTANRRMTVTDPKNNTITYTYDANGNVVTNTEVDISDLGNSNQTFVTTYAYDALDRRIQAVDNVNNTNRSAYDSRHNRVLQIDARNNATRYDYDGLNRLIRTLRDMDANAVFTDPVDIVTSQTWDDSSRLTGQTDDNTNTTAYSYDSLDRRVMTDYADCTTDSTTYDVHDNPITTTDANGSVVTKIYDLNDRPINKTIAPGPGVSPDTTFENYQYDGLSRLIRAEDNDSLVTRRYDSLSRVLQETQQITSPLSPAQSVTAQYDGEGNQTRLVYPGGRAIVRSYDLLDRPVTVQDDPLGTNAPLATYQYIGPARVERRDYGNGTRLELVYDGLRRIASVQHTRISDSSVIYGRFFVWDSNHNKTTSLGSGTNSLFYTYDAANRLVRSQTVLPGSSITYTLDGVGNRTNVSGGTGPGPYTLDPTLCEPGDFQLNQYTTTPVDSRSYDRNGNLTGTFSVPKHYIYDYRNQLVQFTNAATGQTTTYRYDCLGRRTEKNVAGSVTRFHYADRQEIEEQDSAGTTLATYVRGFRNSLLNMTRGGHPKTFHCDDLENSRTMTDANGTVVERYDYGDYGNASFTDGFGNPIAQSAIGNPWLFHRLLFDSESAMYWCGDRYLDISAGRYIQRAGTFWTGDYGNGLTFVYNNPLSFLMPANGQSSNCKNCCCEAKDITIDKIKAEAEGHSFEAKIDLEYKEQAPAKDCELEWWENWSWITEGGVTKGKWQDESKIKPKGKIDREIWEKFFDQWRNPARPCPGPLSITMKDTPTLEGVGGDRTRLLKIAVVVKSSCPGGGNKVAMVTQILSKRDNKIDWDNSPPPVKGYPKYADWEAYKNETSP